MSRRYWQVILFFIAILMEIGFTQEQKRNPTTYPYGGVPDSSRFDKNWMRRIPLNFTKANFDSARFDSQAYFRYAQFDSQAYFWGARFDSQPVFWGARFDSLADFRYARFNSIANFGDARFASLADFWRARFDNLADFWGARFDNLANFKDTRFNSLTDFRGTRFDSLADFGFARFDSWTDFRFARFEDKINFNSAIINHRMNFRETIFNSVSEVDFSLAEIKDTLFVGIRNLSKLMRRGFKDLRTAIQLQKLGFVDIRTLSQLQKYDFMRANLLEEHKEIIKPDTVIHYGWEDTTYYPQKEFNHPGAKIILYGPVALKIQLEKFKFIKLDEGLDYYSKKDIISTLKDTCFSEEKQSKERFELDYIFEKSTMYQKESTNYDTYSVFHPVRWCQFIYNATMGLGYRPFRLIYWILFIIVYYAIKYLRRMPYEVDSYIKDSSNVDKSKISDTVSIFDTLLKCFYFSAMVFFTFRLKSDILAFFNPKDKRIIVTEWLLGFGVYVAFLTLSKAGSILHTLKSLFVG